MKRQVTNCSLVLVGVLYITASLYCPRASAQDSTNSPPVVTNAIRLPTVVVEGRQDSMIGIASSATQETVGATEIQERPILRSGEILETVPGVIITQHAGGGKANQYFLRGFNLDHGTDFAVYLDDMPLNLPSHARQTYSSQWFGSDVENTFGLQVRNDWINNGLYQTEDRVRVDKLDSTPLATRFCRPATEADHFTDTEVGIYAENKTQWTDKFRSVLAIRGDLDYFDVTSLVTPANSGTSATLLPSPKLSLIFGPWAKTEFYAQGGFGFHSNDGRGATQTVEPVSADNPYPGTPVARIPGLVQTKGAEIGVRTLAVPHLQSTLSLWYLYSDSELQQDGDTGSTVASKEPSDRYGVEWANYYTPIKHLAFDFDLADSIARFTSADAADAAPISPAARPWVPAARACPRRSGW